MDKVINIVSLIGWAYLILKIGLQIFVDPVAYLQSDISLDLYVLRAVQLFQIFDIVLILIGKSKGSILGSFFQILGRNIVSLIFMQEQSDKLKFAAVVIIWGISDANRYLYYIFKNNLITGLLRYNSFLVLYPIGVFGQMTIINDFILRHQDQVTDVYLYIIRFVQFGIIVGMLLIYKHMLKSRKKYMKTISEEGGSEREIGQSNKSAARQKSPKREVKRD